jgi:hypothetical protein
MRFATHALKDESNCNSECIREQASVAANTAALLTMVKEPPAQLHDKEITGCMLATD